MLRQNWKGHVFGGLERKTTTPFDGTLGTEKNIKRCRFQGMIFCIREENKHELSRQILKL